MNSSFRRLKAFRHFAGLGAALAAWIFLPFGCGRQAPTREAPSKTVLASSPPLQEWIECQGIVKAERAITRFLNPGEHIARVFVRQGVRVRKGQLLIEMTNASLTDQFASLSARKRELQEKSEEISILELEIQKARRKLVRIDEEIQETLKMGRENPQFPAKAETLRLSREKEILAEDVTIQEKRRDLARGRVGDAAAALRDLDLRIGDIRRQLGDLAMAAPFDGLIAFIPDFPESLQPGGLAFELWDDGKKNVEAFIWQHQMARLTLGLDASIYAGLDENVTARGRVRHIDAYPIRVETSGYPQYKALIEIGEGAEKLQIGMSVSLRIKMADAAPQR